MFEQTNQTQSAAEEASAFSGEAFESGMELTASGPAGSENNIDENSPAAEATQTDETKYTVKYNGKTVDLTLDELKTRAQMGMNYDHVKSENDRIKNSQLYKTLRSMAQKEGMSLEEYGKKLESRNRESRLQELQSSGMQNAAAKQFLEMEAKAEAAERAQHEREPYLAFVRKFPQVAVQDITPEVWERFHETGDLVYAYTEAENEKLRAQIRTMEQNEKNARAHIGSLANDRASAHTDAFLEGLLG